MADAPLQSPTEPGSSDVPLDEAMAGRGWRCPVEALAPLPPPPDQLSGALLKVWPVVKERLLEIRLGDHALGRLAVPPPAHRPPGTSRRAWWFGKRKGPPKLAVWGERRWWIAQENRRLQRAQDDRGREAAWWWQPIFCRRGSVVLADGWRLEVRNHVPLWGKERWEVVDAYGERLLTLIHRYGANHSYGPSEIQLGVRAGDEPELGLLCLLLASNAMVWGFTTP
jgi:hypothetical protein